MASTNDHCARSQLGPTPRTATSVARTTTNKGQPCSPTPLLKDSSHCGCRPWRQGYSNSGSTPTTPSSVLKTDSVSSSTLSSCSDGTVVSNEPSRPPNCPV